MPPYVAVTNPSWDNSLTIIDVSNPAAPVFLGHIAGAGAPNFLGDAWHCYYFTLVPAPAPRINRAHAFSREEL